MIDESPLKPPEKSGAAPSATGAGLPADARSGSGRPVHVEASHGWLARILGWITLAGLILLIVSFGVGPDRLPYPIPITLLACGACCFFLAGMPWAHMRGQRGLKATYLGTVAFFAGGGVGAFAGAVLGDALGGNNQLGMTILALIAGFWVGAIPFAWLGIWWTIRFHRRYGLDERGGTHQKG